MWQALRDILKIKFVLFTSAHADKTLTFSEFISPVILAAATIVKAVTLRAEYPIQGRRGAGPVDYVALYKFLCILIAV